MPTIHPIRLKRPSFPRQHHRRRNTNNLAAESRLVLFPRGECRVVSRLVPERPHRRTDAGPIHA